MGMYEYQFLVQEDTANTVDAVGTNALDTQLAPPGWEKTGVNGLHVVVTTSFGNLTEGVNLTIVHSDSDDITTSSTKHTSMFVAAADMTKGRHHFVPFGSIPLKRYVGFFFDAVSTAANAGKSTVYFGPRQGGEG